MFAISHSAFATKPLNSSTISQLKKLNVQYSSECGWTIAHGRDDNGKLIISVHAKDISEFYRHLEPNRFMESKIVKLKQRGLTGKDLERAIRREKDKAIIMGGVDFGYGDY
tara:strand:- start:40751 stop:41083 length:333 start_codon:yes stop_codon:yes gene_type:complete